MLQSLKNHHYCLPFTSSVIGYDQEALVVDAERLPVHSSVSLQSLVTEEPSPTLIPPVDNGQLRLRLPGVSHHQENLTQDEHSTSVI